MQCYRCNDKKIGGMGITVETSFAPIPNKYKLFLCIKCSMDFDRFLKEKHLLEETNEYPEKKKKDAIQRQKI